MNQNNNTQNNAQGNFNGMNNGMPNINNQAFDMSNPMFFINMQLQQTIQTLTMHNKAQLNQITLLINRVSTLQQLALTEQQQNLMCCPHCDKTIKVCVSSVRAFSQTPQVLDIDPHAPLSAPSSIKKPDQTYFRMTVCPIANSSERQSQEPQQQQEQQPQIHLQIYQ